MRADQVNHFAPLAEERATFPSLGGDGVVLVRSVGFGQKIQLSIAQPEQRAAMLLHYAVRDESGAMLMSIEQWDIFGLRHEDDFLELAAIARRVSAFDVDEAKKD